MGLTTYRQKRSFKQTPEPRGKGRRSGKALRFVVQKHAATRLHYDFRLELGGVLVSWAVPKGPSLNPNDKRLAMKVEDHPFDYRSFEGTIPEGNYGAGAVMVWDEGTYEPFEEGDDQEKIFRAGLKRGDLKFILHGQKLSGAYAIVKMKGRGENNWLMIKKQDEGATTQDVTKQDRSVKTGRTLEEIAEGKKAKKLKTPKKKTATKVAKKSGRAPKPRKTKVSKVAPMLAKLVDAPFDRPDWLFEPKWDGYRAVAEVTGKRIKLYSRNHQPFNDEFPTVVGSLQKLGHPAVIDGEVLAVTGKGQSSFQALQNYRKTGEGTVVYKVFDLLSLDGYDIRRLELRERKELLSTLVEGIPGIEYSAHIEESGIRYYEDAVKRGLEGVIAKAATSPYITGARTEEWVKIKSVKRQEAVIGGFTAPRGSRKGFGALLLGYYDAGEFIYMGHTGTGFSSSLITELHGKLRKLERKSSPFTTAPKPNAPVTWVKPQLVCEVKFQEWTEDGRARQPALVGLRTDKKAKEVRREVAEPTPALGDAADGPDELVVKVGGHRLTQTNLSKIYWPQDKFTKGDLIAYYDSIASVILPYLKGRPESLNRHPSGIEGPSFYQKDVADQPPSWVKTRSVFSESNDKHINYLICEDKATLLYLANLGCIELNPWLSRVPKLLKPDFLLIDLDAKTSEFKTVVEVAHEIRKLLEEIGLKSYPKTSGKTGMHICLPLGAQYSYEQSKQLAEILMLLVHERLPKITSVERKPEKRAKKIYLDYLQNRKGQTMAAPYCVRPVPGASVSTPLTWDEVTPQLDPTKFTMTTIQKRLDKVGDLWKPVLGKGIDLKKTLAALEKLQS